jgi:hypothetical protein
MFQAYHGVTGAQHQTNFNRLSAQGFRMISLSVYGDPGDARYAAVWVQRQGTAWVAVHGVDSAGYQSFFNNWTAKGYVLVLVSATGTSSNAIFAAVFEQGIPGAWFARHGMTSGPDTNAGTFQNLNKTASNQKMILRSVAIYGTAVYPLLGFSQPLDPRSDTITIQQLLDHMGGYNDDPLAKGGSGFDPTYHMREIALALNLGHPVTKLDVARYMYGRMLDLDPGTVYHYSNFGYLLAGAVVEQVTGMKYFDYVKATLLHRGHSHAGVSADQ